MRADFKCFIRTRFEGLQSVCRGGVFEGVDGGSQHPLGVAADVQILRRCLELMGSWLGWLIGSHL